MTMGVINRPLIRSVALAAAAIGTIQAALWACLSLISILFYHTVITIDTNLSYFNYESILYEIFLNSDYKNEDVIMTSEVFNVFMYVYMVASCVWLLSSLYMLWAMKRNKWNGSSFIIGFWSGITILISVLDVLTISLVAADYVTIQDLCGQSVSSSTTQLPTIITTPITTPTESTVSYPTSIETSTSEFPSSISTSISTDLSTTSSSDVTGAVEQIFSKSLLDLLAVDASVFQNLEENKLIQQVINTSYIIVITLAARGYILWIINVVLAIILFKFARDISKAKAPSLLPMIDGYPTSRSPWTNLYEQTDIGNGYSNNGFSDDHDRAIFPRSDSFITAEPENNNQNPLSNGKNPYARQMEKLRPISANPNIVSPKLAKIGKQNGRRTPPRNVPPPNIPLSNYPYIPDPDYSPPGSPLKPKSVLRPRSNYVL